jgi:hypothetical protein
VISKARTFEQKVEDCFFFFSAFAKWGGSFADFMEMLLQSTMARQNLCDFVLNELIF